MESTMERERMARPVGFGGAFVEQLRLLWMSRRPLLMVLGLVGVLALAGDPWSDSVLARLLTPWPFWLLVVGPFWAFAVWHNEGPSNRHYFWSQPVGRTTHALARLAAGAAWLALMVLFLILIGAMFAAFEGHLSHFEYVGFAAWLNLFTSPLIGYLMVSVLAVASDHPIRWFLAFLFGIPITLSLLVEGLGLGDLVETIMTPLIDPDWGLGPAMVAPFALAAERLYDGVLNRPTGSGPDVFDLRSWALAMPLWVAFWTGVVFLFARTHPDVFPRWRRSG